MKKKHPEHANHERWLVSYADFITLLFAFFVIMYAISQADIAKFKKVSASIRAAFSPSGNSAGSIELEGAAGGGNTVNPFEQIDPAGGRVISMPAGKANTAAERDPQIQEIRELLEETVSLEMGTTDLSDKMQMVFDSNGLIVRLAARDFFDQGGVEVRPDLRPLLDRVGKVMAGTQRLIRIEGHADISEAKTPGYRSDWELSAARAAWVARYWINRFNMDPKRIGVAGYGHYRPVSAGKNAWGRGANRRVEFIILNNTYHLDQK